MWEIFYPRRCVLCDNVLSTKEEYLCEMCNAGEKPVFVSENYCMKCGKPVEEGIEYCSDCEGREMPFLYGRAAFLYDSRMKESMMRFKYYGRREYAAFYGKMLYRCFGEWIEKIAPDALIPVPVHKERYRRRGYNQAQLVAEELAKYCGVSVVTDYLIRIKNTLSQKELSGRERFANLCRAFSVTDDAPELYKSLKCVIIIDDIYTTGSTVRACSQVLKEQGIRDIFFLSVCIGKGF